MSRFALVQARLASALIITGAILSSAGSADAVGFAADPSALARAMLSKSPVAGARTATPRANEDAASVDSLETARRLLEGHSANMNERAATPISDRSATTLEADDGGTADASDAARRMIVGNGG